MQRELLFRNPLFRDIPEDMRDALARIACVRHYTDGSILHLRGDEPDGLYLVLKGCVRATSSTADGREALLALIEPGTWFGESSVLEGRPRAYDASADGNVDLLVIPAEQLNALLGARPELYRHFIPLLCQRIRLSTMLLESNALLSLEGRLASRLLVMSQNVLQGSGEQPRLTLRLSQEALSQMLGTTRQSINKVLGEWERNGLIRRQYGRIILCDTAGLQQLALPG